MKMVRLACRDPKRRLVRKILYRRGAWVAHHSANRPGMIGITHAPTGYGVPLVFPTLRLAKHAIAQLASAVGAYTDPYDPPAEAKRFLAKWWRETCANLPEGWVRE